LPQRTSTLIRTRVKSGEMLHSFTNNKGSIKQFTSEYGGWAWGNHKPE
jgi:hypothetical protein